MISKTSTGLQVTCPPDSLENEAVQKLICIYKDDKMLYRTMQYGSSEKQARMKASLTILAEMYPLTTWGSFVEKLR